MEARAWNSISILDFETLFSDFKELLQQIPLGVTFSNAVAELKAQSSNVSFQWNVAKETFELWAFENVTSSGIGCKWKRPEQSWLLSIYAMFLQCCGVLCGIIWRGQSSQGSTPKRLRKTQPRAMTFSARDVGIQILPIFANLHPVAQRECLGHSSPKNRVKISSTANCYEITSHNGSYLIHFLQLAYLCPMSSPFLTSKFAYFSPAMCLL